MGLISYFRDAFDITNTDKGYYHTYEHMYSFIFHNFTPKNILEIGVKNGRSIAAWQKLFPETNITGMDIIKNKLVIPEDSFNYMIGDSTNPIFTDKLDKQDVIIDDGSHYFYDQIKTFDNLKDKFNFFYVIEDINFVKQSNDASLDYSLSAIRDVVMKNGFKGIAIFDSYNERKITKSMVIQSANF